MRTSAIFFRLCPYYSIFKELENFGDTVSCIHVQVQQTFPETETFPTILVDLGFFRGKKYLDFKNF
jgi:hypothetical protein